MVRKDYGYDEELTVKQVKKVLAGIVIPLLIGSGIGFLCAAMAIRMMPEGASDSAYFINLGLVLAFMVVSMWLHIILHEGGTTWFSA